MNLEQQPARDASEFAWEDGKFANISSGGVWGPDDLLRGSTQQLRENVNVVESAFRSLRTSIAYVSMPISSGKRWYDTCTKYGVKTREELAAIDNEAFQREVIEPNARAGEAFARDVESRTKFPVLIPAVFEAKNQRWRDEEYMALWYRVIEGKAAEIHLIKDWEYSNGGVEEFVRGTEIQFGLSRIESKHNIRVLDHKGDDLTVETGATRIAMALKDLRNRGFEAPRLEIALRKLENIGQFGLSSARSRNTEPPQKYDLNVLVACKELADQNLAVQ